MGKEIVRCFVNESRTRVDFLSLEYWDKPIVDGELIEIHREIPERLVKVSGTDATIKADDRI